MEAVVSAGEMVAEGFGLPVEIGRIDRELGRLWEEAGESKTRASLINLVLYSEKEDELAPNTRLLAELASRHACRAIVILAMPEEPTSRAQAWINAHCHMAGQRQICSEQITFRLEGDAASALPGIVFSHLDSDLPLCLWWQAPFRKTMDEDLWSWVDRLIYDSAKWDQPADAFDLLQSIGSSGGGRTVLGDLNWARVLGARIALAALFDHASALAAIPSLDRVELVHAPGSRTSALLLLGWFASRLGWNLQPTISPPVFLSREGHPIECVLEEKEGETISRCTFAAGAEQFCLSRQPGHEFFEATVGGPDAENHPRVLTAGKESLPDLLLSELSRGGRHGHYRQAVSTIRPLLEKNAA